jgi:hypothetical protein
MTENHTPAELANTHAPALSAASALIGNPAEFGRVAEDGTVYVRTNSGEISSWFLSR